MLAPLQTALTCYTAIVYSKHSALLISDQEACHVLLLCVSQCTILDISDQCLSAITSKWKNEIIGLRPIHLKLDLADEVVNL